MVNGVRRTYWLARPPRPEAPLIIVLHGLGMTGKDMDRFTGLVRRGPSAGFATVFPNGWSKKWDDGPRQPGSSRREEIDDPEFLRALVAQLEADGVARAGVVFLVGLSNGAYLTEYVARHRLLPVTGIVLVAGTATEPNRRLLPLPAQSAEVLCFTGTADPVVPYSGGSRSAEGVVGWMVRRRAGRRPGDPASVIAGVETVAGDWAEANGDEPTPVTSRIEPVPGDLAVTRMSWTGPGRPSVVLYRIEGGGHTWPGGPQFLPARFVGPVARHLDATGILLEMAGKATTASE